MSAIGRTENQGYLKCNHTEKRRPACGHIYEGHPGETVDAVEARARQSGWATVTGFGGAAHLCPKHNPHGTPDTD